jgi:hypothetical protein
MENRPEGLRRKLEEEEEEEEVIGKVIHALSHCVPRKTNFFLRIFPFIQLG